MHSQRKEHSFPFFFVTLDYCRILSHNSFNGSLPVEIQNLTRLESMVVNYNSFSGVFPVAWAPPLMTFCLVQPNAFQDCPPIPSVENSTTLAYQCNLDCSGIVSTQKKYTHATLLFTISVTFPFRPSPPPRDLRHNFEYVSFKGEYQSRPNLIHLHCFHYAWHHLLDEYLQMTHTNTRIKLMTPSKDSGDTVMRYR